MVLQAGAMQPHSSRCCRRERNIGSSRSDRSRVSNGRRDEFSTPVTSAKPAGADTLLQMDRRGLVVGWGRGASVPIPRWSYMEKVHASWNCFRPSMAFASRHCRHWKKRMGRRESWQCDLDNRRPRGHLVGAQNGQRDHEPRRICLECGRSHDVRLLCLHPSKSQWR